MNAGNNIALRTHPSDCQIGDGILESSVSEMIVFDTQASATRYTVPNPKALQGRLPSDGSFVAIHHPTLSWIFERNLWVNLDGSEETLWIRTR